MDSASSALMPRRTLHTRQMRLVCWLRSLMRCSSQNPISRSRRAISGDAESCLIRQADPTRNLLNGQTKGLAAPSVELSGGDFRFTARHHTVIETRLQEGFPGPRSHVLIYILPRLADGLRPAHVRLLQWARQC